MSASSVRPGHAVKPRGNHAKFAIRDLSVLAYAQGFTLWHYKARQDALPCTGEHGFFDDAADMLACGDIVMISSSGGARILMISGIEGGVTAAALG